MGLCKLKQRISKYTKYTSEQEVGVVPNARDTRGGDDGQYQWLQMDAHGMIRRNAQTQGKWWELIG